jgi:hypothetical protein
VLSINTLCERLEADSDASTVIGRPYLQRVTSIFRNKLSEAGGSAADLCIETRADGYL